MALWLILRIRLSLTDHPRLEYMRQLLDYHVRSLGQEVIRADPQHSLLCGAAADPSEESVALLAEPISMIVAQFGTSIPVGSKFKVHMDQNLHVFVVWIFVKWYQLWIQRLSISG